MSVTLPVLWAFMDLAASYYLFGAIDEMVSYLAEGRSLSRWTEIFTSFVDLGFGPRRPQIGTLFLENV